MLRPGHHLRGLGRQQEIWVVTREPAISRVSFAGKFVSQQCVDEQNGELCSSSAVAASLQRPPLQSSEHGALLEWVLGAVYFEMYMESTRLTVVTAFFAHMPTLLFLFIANVFVPVSLLKGLVQQNSLRVSVR